MCIRDSAYGHLIPPSVFSEPKYGLVNAHFSLVPKYRGAAPMQRALIRGEKETGVSLFQIEKGLDTGPVFLQGRYVIAPEDNAATLRPVSYTHLQQEAMEISGKILVMAKGRIEQEGSPLEIFDRPATPFVAQFVGETNIVESVVSAPELALWGPFRFTVVGPSEGCLLYTSQQRQDPGEL